MDWQAKFEKDTGISKEDILTGATDRTPIDYHCDMTNYLIEQLCLIDNLVKAYTPNSPTSELTGKIRQILGE